MNCRCWNEGQYGRVHREDCPIHGPQASERTRLPSSGILQHSGGRGMGLMTPEDLRVAVAHETAKLRERLSALARENSELRAERDQLNRRLR